MTTMYWTIGRRIFEDEQGGSKRAGYGDEFVKRLAADLSARFGRGFGRRNLSQMRAFYLVYREIVQTPSALSASEASSSIQVFPLPWSHYVRLLAVRNLYARRFYEEEALRGGGDRSIGQVAKDLDLTETALREWVR